jgi:hypothetical protein
VCEISRNKTYDFFLHITYIMDRNPLPCKCIARNVRIGNIPQLSVTDRKEHLNISNFINIIDLTITDQNNFTFSL